MSFVKEVYKNIYQAQIPLPNSPLKELNSYIIKGKERNMVVDVGFNNDVCHDAMNRAFSKLNIEYDNTDMFITHLHMDHAGLSSRLKTPSNKIYASEHDSRVINDAHNRRIWGMMFDECVKMGFSEPDLDMVQEVEKRSVLSKPVEHNIVSPGDILKVGDYSFTVVDLAGHTPGQVGLYEKNHKLLFCGDHILNKITPNIAFWHKDFDALGVYMQKLKDVRKMDVKFLFSAHRINVSMHTERIDRLLEHHKKRLAGCMNLIEQKPRTVYEVASLIKWDYGDGDFKSFPIAQKWFAGGEIYAHLEHLLKLGKLKKNLANKAYLYSI